MDIVIRKSNSFSYVYEILEVDYTLKTTRLVGGIARLKVGWRETKWEVILEVDKYEENYRELKCFDN